MSRFAILGAATLISVNALAAPGNVDLVALEAFASDVAGYPLRPKQAEPFYCTIRFQVRGNLTKSYSVRFSSPYHSMTTTAVNFGQGAPGEYQITWGPMPSLMDSPIQLNATLLPSRGLRELSSRNNIAAFVVWPEAPDRSIEFFAPQNLLANLSLNARWRSYPGTTRTWLPVPATGSFQEVQSVWTPTGNVGDSGSALLIDQDPYEHFEISNEISSTVTASSQRINRGMLRSANFGDYSSDTSAANWLNPETYVEIQSAAIRSFAMGAMGRAASNTPFDVAEAIYAEVLKRCAYSSRPGQAPSAASTLRNRRGDCGGLSSLFVASCRTQGIPARTVAGFVLGNNQWHVWAEFYVPRHGWVAVDPAYAKGKMPRNTLPLYFGVMPDLNQRFACTFGFDVRLEGAMVPLLQAPTVFWSRTQSRLSFAKATSTLQFAN